MTEYERCGRQKRDGSGDTCGLPAGWGTDHTGEGACKLHGGAGGAPSGERNGAYKHGLNSEVLRDEDQEMLDAIEEMTTTAKMEETLNLQVVKLYRAVDGMESDERTSFMDAFGEMVSEASDEGDGLDKGKLRYLAQMLGENDRAIREWIDLIRKTAKDLHKMRDGETVNVEHGVDSDELAELREMADDLF